MCSSPSRRILLVVDDDAAIRETLSELLRDEGYEVVTAANGRDALDALRREDAVPCLIILDLMMPVMSGEEFYREKQNDDELAEIPVVVISADGNLRRKAQQLRADYLAKPVKLEVILDKIAEHCA